MRTPRKDNNDIHTANYDWFFTCTITDKLYCGFTPPTTYIVSSATHRRTFAADGKADWLHESVCSRRESCTRPPASDRCCRGEVHPVPTGTRALLSSLQTLTISTSAVPLFALQPTLATCCLHRKEKITITT